MGRVSGLAVYSVDLRYIDTLLSRQRPDGGYLNGPGEWTCGVLSRLAVYLVDLRYIETLLSRQRPDGGYLNGPGEWNLYVHSKHKVSHMGIKGG